MIFTYGSPARQRRAFVDQIEGKGYVQKWGTDFGE
jgi:hypothetical protein